MTLDYSEVLFSYSQILESVKSPEEYTLWASEPNLFQATDVSPG